MKSFKTLRMVITIVDVVCLLAVLFVPALEAAKHNFFVWLILGLLTLYVLFMWMVLGRRNTNGYDAESDREADIEYSCAMKSHFRKFGNQMSGSGNHLCNYASLLA